jgi:hypothetical protein
LVSAHDGIDRLVLADDALVQSARQLSGFRAYLRGVECLSEPFHNASALVPATTLDSGDERCVSCAPSRRATHWIVAISNKLKPATSADCKGK